ncbi:hypothetical protein CC80DRAFT_490506 [Byssothecium circinans]|uniref:Uncharacterized protein n=1 Tax=Byssothecium circinans TaxID=147558 RepID=A0A6A5U168_9PLEO|nr:hypothetical protein CC80DRAFT_490506 [Byssothecium circinans]
MTGGRAGTLASLTLVRSLHAHHLEVGARTLIQIDSAIGALVPQPPPTGSSHGCGSVSSTPAAARDGQHAGTRAVRAQTLSR